MQPLIQAFRDNPELAIFLTLALGFWLGNLRLGRFSLGGPGRMAIAGFAPPLDTHGNSVRAQQAIEYISSQLDLNIFGSAK